MAILNLEKTDAISNYKKKGFEMQIKFNLPLPKKLENFVTDWKYWKPTILQRLRPLRCGCGRKVYMAQPGYKNANGLSVAFSLRGNFTKPICRDCTAKIIESTWEKASNAEQLRSHNNCDCCGNEASTVRHYSKTVSFYFAHNGCWNRSYICLDCVIDSVCNGKIESSCYVATASGKLYMRAPSGSLIFEHERLK